MSDLTTGRIAGTSVASEQPLSPDAPATLGSHYRPVAVVRGDARNLGLRDNSVDLIVTSPPYFALRSYQDGGEHYDGQVGAEATPAEFVDTLIACTREWMRVLKPSGSLWVNLGDKYMATSFAPGQRGKDTPGTPRPTVTRSCERCGVEFTGGPGRRFCSSYCGGSDNSPRVKRKGIPTKSLIGIPWRYALRCIDELGLILRAEVIWSKPNGLPESVTDRVRRSHEQWFHFTLNPRYFSAVDEVREQYAPASLSSYARGGAANAVTGLHPSSANGAQRGDIPEAWTGNPLGKLPGSVWTVPTEPLNVPEHLGVDHFAVFPSEWPRRIIQGWSPCGVCVECGEGRRPVTETAHVNAGGAKDRTTAGHVTALPGQPDGRVGARLALSSAITGYACACPEPIARTRPAVVLDPFGGTGTTALVASVLGRLGVTVDLSGDYCRLARWRTTDPGERARAMRVEKPPKQIDGQVDLFGEAS